MKFDCSIGGPSTAKQAEDRPQSRSAIINTNSSISSYNEEYAGGESGRSAVPS